MRLNITGELHVCGIVTSVSASQEVLTDVLKHQWRVDKGTSASHNRSISDNVNSV